MHSTPTTCPACLTPCAANEAICATCGLLFASYAPAASNTAPPQVAAFTYMPLIPGRSLANDRFTVRQALSKGGMGAIYLASDNEAFGRLVVVKAMLDYFDPADVRAVQEAHARFLQEARTLSGLRHPAIPQIFTYFQDGPHNYIVMEYIEGHDLEQLLTRRDDVSGRVIKGHAYPQSDVLRWGVALCQVLGYLASRQPHAVVHHDIKPANLLLDSSSDDIRLVDFGTAKARLLALSGSVGLQQSSVHGTQGYAAPEQYRGQSEPRSDVYALAATLYHLATDDDPRAHPFDFPQLAQLGTFGHALRGALDVDPSQRPTAAQLQHRLELLSMPTSARPIQAPDGTDLADIDSLVAWCEQHWRTGAAWLYDQLPAQIELWWGQTKLAHDLHAIVKRYSHDTSAGLDAMLALLDPSGFGTQQQQIATDQSHLDFGTLASKAQPERTVTLSNPGRRYVQADIKLPHWVLAPRRIRLPPGEQLALQLIVDQPRANKRGKLSEDIFLQDGTTTLLRVEAHATVAHWRRIWQRVILLVAAFGIGMAVLWPPYVQSLVQPLVGAYATAPDPNAAHYQAAMADMNSHDWDSAIHEFEQLTGTYYDGAVLLQQSYYNGAKAALQRKDWTIARTYLERIIDYSDARKLLQESYILEAQHTGALLVLDANAHHATFGPDGKLLITPARGDIFEIRHMPDGRLLHTFNGLHSSQVLDVARSPDGQTLAFCHENGLIKFARTDDGTTLRIIEGNAGKGQALQWSPDGRMLASYGLDVVELWRANGTLLQTLPVNQPDTSVVSVVFSLDGQTLATGSADGSIKLWRTDDGKLLKEIRTPANGIQQMIFRDQGRALVVLDSDAKLSIWQVSNKALLLTTNLPMEPLYTRISAFSPDGQIIATNNPNEAGQQVTLWRVADGYALKHFSLLHTGAMSISFSADGKQLVIADGGGRIVLWNVPN